MTQRRGREITHVQSEFTVGMITCPRKLRHFPGNFPENSWNCRDSGKESKFQKKRETYTRSATIAGML
jgi:hypothetical protein